MKQVERRSTIKIRGVGKGKTIASGERIERMGMTEREKRSGIGIIVKIKRMREVIMMK